MRVGEASQFLAGVGAPDTRRTVITRRDYRMPIIREGGDYAMSGAVGQADTGTLSGGDYSLGGGFFGGGIIAGPTRVSTYLPLLQR